MTSWPVLTSEPTFPLPSRPAVWSSVPFFAGSPPLTRIHSRIPLFVPRPPWTLSHPPRTSHLPYTPPHIIHNGRLQHVQDCAPPRHGRQHRLPEGCLQCHQDLRQQDRRKSRLHPSPSFTISGGILYSFRASSLTRAPSHSPSRRPSPPACPRRSSRSRP